MLKIGYLDLDNPIAIISSNNRFESLRSFGDFAGLMMLSSFNLKNTSLPELEKAISEANTTSSAIGFSVIAWNRESIIQAAKLAVKERCLLEMDCTPFSKLDQVVDMIKDVKGVGATLSVKIKPQIIDDLGETVKRLKGSSVDMVHVDLIDLGAVGLKILKKASNAGAPAIMARCDVKDFEEAKSIFSMGADLISLSDCTDPEFAVWLAEVIKKFDDITGWYNAPKHICSGGDLRALAFCCLPVKDCPVLGTLHKIGMSPKEFATKKMELAKGTPLEHGDGTCFGSLVWCCKITKPCFMRDSVLQRTGLSPNSYMKLKKKLAEDLLNS